MTEFRALPPIDTDAAAALWAEYSAAHPDWAAAGPEYVTHFFGDHVALADDLITLVISGQKRATAQLVSEYLAENEPLPRVGTHLISCDGSGTPRIVLRSHRIRIAPFWAADAEFAATEGEHDGSLEMWRAGHERYFRRTQAARGLEFDEDAELTYEEFTAVWPPELADPAPTRPAA